MARRPGISVRTCRAHISRLMRTLDAPGRTRLGSLIARSGWSRKCLADHRRQPAPRYNQPPRRLVQLPYA
ncbi:hypothetical protein ACFXPY_45300 [Streptomyces sp. NPDC059153]|uniref:hypothetical protein n=1 Tax=Streptomyces sp. NPDC059153 TaxID=3346743 RepID=UPI003684EDAA